MTSDTNEDWLRGNEEQLDNSSLSLSKPAIDEVDALADELATDYDNQSYRTWYCGVIYEFGIEKVCYWRQKASAGNFPGKLFSYYVRQARSGKLHRQSHDETNNAVVNNGLDTGYPVRGDETDDELRTNMLTALADAGLPPVINEGMTNKSTNEDLLQDVNKIFFAKGAEL